MGRAFRMTMAAVAASFAVLGAAQALSPLHAAADKPRSPACRTDTLTIQTAVDAYYNDHGVRPNGMGASNTGGTARTRAGQAVDLAALVGAYLHSLPNSDDSFSFGNSTGLVVGHIDNHKQQC